MGSDSKVDRRKFMEIGIYTITGAIAATSSVALARFAIGNSFEKQKAKWIEIDFEENPEESFSRVVIEYTKKDGWLTADARSLIYIKRTPEDGVIAISATCSHLGCIVSWDEADKKFKCPCHNGVYDVEGKVVSGPPPAPLRRHKTKMEDGTLLVSTETISYGENADESV